MRRIEKNWLEWSVFATGLLLVIATLGFLLADSVTTQSSPPVLEVSVGTARPANAGFLLPLTVTNTGGQTADNVLIEVVVEADGKPTERAELRLDLLARKATRQAWVVLERDPRQARVSARAVGYQAP